jgi:hypothetical protein
MKGRCMITWLGDEFVPNGLFDRGESRMRVRLRWTAFRRELRLVLMSIRDIQELPLITQMKTVDGGAGDTPSVMSVHVVALMVEVEIVVVVVVVVVVYAIAIACE